MNFIFSNLGPNKVTQQIVSNEYEETNFCVEEVNLFDEIENPIDILRSKSKKPTVRKTVADNSNSSDSSDPPASKQLADPKNLTGVIRCILRYLDPTSALVSHDDHIIDFKKKLVFSAEMTKKSVVRGLNVKELVANDDLSATKYISFVLKKSVALKLDDQWSFFGYPDHVECLVLTYENGCFLVEHGSPVDVKVVKMRIVRERGLQQKLNSLMVKDLKELATFLDIPTADSAKKPLLKKELYDVIANHLKVV